MAVMPTPDNLKRIETKRKDYEKTEAERRERQKVVLVET